MTISTSSLRPPAPASSKVWGLIIWGTSCSCTPFYTTRFKIRVKSELNNTISKYKVIEDGQPMRQLPLVLELVWLVLGQPHWPASSYLSVLYQPIGRQQSQCDKDCGVGIEKYVIWIWLCSSSRGESIVEWKVGAQIGFVWAVCVCVCVRICVQEWWFVETIRLLGVDT
jgi:hypothetical protein